MPTSSWLFISLPACISSCTGLKRCVEESGYTRMRDDNCDLMQRQARSIFRAKGVYSGSTVLLAGEKVTYAARLLLPPHLPPSFHGTAVRFAYNVSASCTVALHRDEVLASDDDIDATSQVPCKEKWISLLE
jgi:hypothetical protein